MTYRTINIYDHVLRLSPFMAVLETSDGTILSGMSDFDWSELSYSRIAALLFVKAAKA